MKKYNVTELTKLIGRELGISSWIILDQDRIDRFAKLTEDEQFIHVDPERAVNETTFGGTIAHGFLTLSMLVKMASDAQPKIEGVNVLINYGFDKIRFIAPVRAGAKIRSRFVLNEITYRNENQILTKWDITVEIKDSDKPAIKANWLNLLIIYISLNIFLLKMHIKIFSQTVSKFCQLIRSHWLHRRSQILPLTMSSSFSQ